MTRKEARKTLVHFAVASENQITMAIDLQCRKAIEMAIKALEQPDRNAQERYEDLCEYFKDCSDKGMGILGDRKEFKAWLERLHWHVVRCDELGRELEKLKSAQPDLGKYEYHYDHTDCIWYRPEARNRCPSTCAQYRDGWNDAMNYIFRDGKGYRPYRRDRRYENGDSD